MSQTERHDVDVEPAHETYDWLSVGSGVAGLAGALVAAVAGRRALVVEKMDRLGGQTAYSYGALFAAVGSMQDDGPTEDAVAAADAYVRWLTGGFYDEGRLRTLCDDAAPALRFFAGHGVPMRPIRGLPDLYFPFAPGSQELGHTFEVEPLAATEAGFAADLLIDSPYLPPGVSWSDAVSWGGFGRAHDWDPEALERCRHQFAAGQGLIAWLVRACLAAGVEIVTSTALRSLVVEGGRVTGAEVERRGRLRRIATTATLLGTGGYEAEPRLVNAYEAFPLQNHALAGQTGDGFVAAAEIGAWVSLMPLRLVLNLGFEVPDDHDGVGFRTAFTEQAAPSSMIVNRAGRRFADESFFQEVAVGLRAFDVYEHRYTNLPCFLVFDSQFASCQPFAGRAPGVAIPDWVPRADTLTALAGKLGIEPDGLETTVAAFNEHARYGTDPAFGRGKLLWAQRSSGDATSTNPLVGTVERPPFYAVELRPTSLGSAGLVADQDGRVIHIRGHAIPGLYATGNVTTCNEYGAGYQAGLSLTSALVFGRRAVRDAFAPPV